MPKIAKQDWLFFASGPRLSYDPAMSQQNRSRRRQSYNIPGHAHEVTFSCYRRYGFLKAERTCHWLAEAIQEARQSQAFWLWAFVFMPDHVHLIIYPYREEYDMGRILETIKRPVGEKAIRHLRRIDSPWLARLTRQRGSRTERLFWQSGGGYDRNITSPRTLPKMIDYLHENPLRKGLVVDPREWNWSSVRHYEGGESPLTIDPIPAEWLEVES
jgi:putative transposase